MENEKSTGIWEPLIACIDDDEDDDDDDDDDDDNDG